ERIFAYLESYLQREPVSTFVVGMPRQMDGRDSQSAQHVIGFVRQLRKKFPAVETVTIDERFTSKMATRAIAQSGLRKTQRQRKSLVDEVYATIILQSYLEQRELSGQRRTRDDNSTLFRKGACERYISSARTLTLNQSRKEKFGSGLRQPPNRKVVPPANSVSFFAPMPTCLP